jgi:phosphoribosylanthranilate isomerase
MFRVKICGVTTPEDARTAAEAGADAVGLNFYPKSPRYLAPEAARAVAGAVPRGVVKVGLFVNAPVEEVCRAFDGLGLDLVQLHGDEPPQVLADLEGRPVMRAFRLGPEGMLPVGEYLGQCEQLGRMPELVLLDAFRKGAYGGTGEVADWSAAKTYRPVGDRPLPPLVLAGGLTPENVAEAIRTVRPAAVDTASGVESAPGRKDPELVRRFVRAAIEALESVG